MAATLNFLGVMSSGCAVAFAMVYLLPVEMVAGIGTMSEIAFVLALVVTAVLWNTTTHMLDGQPELEGLGIFGSITFADEDTNPWRTSVAFGVGGRGLIPGRPNDLFGIGGFYNDLASNQLVSTADYEEDYAGMEAFYNLFITPAVRFSVNAQYLPSVLPGIKASTMITGRLQLLF